jgi:hypothetical protein
MPRPPAWGETELGGANLDRNGMPRPPAWGEIELSGAGSTAARTHVVLPTGEAEQGRHVVATSDVVRVCVPPRRRPWGDDGGQKDASAPVVGGGQ